MRNGVNVIQSNLESGLSGFESNAFDYVILSQTLQATREPRWSVVPPWGAILTFGEGWHNNHHYYPASTRQGFYWWEIDLTYYGLKVLSWTGLIWDLKPVPASVLAEGRVFDRALLDKVEQEIFAISKDRYKEKAASMKDIGRIMKWIVPRIASLGSRMSAVVSGRWSCPPCVNRSPQNSVRVPVSIMKPHSQPCGTWGASNQRSACLPT